MLRPENHLRTRLRRNIRLLREELTGRRFEEVREYKSRSPQVKIVCPSCGHVTYRTVMPERVVCVKCGYTWTTKIGEVIEVGAFKERERIERARRPRYCEACHAELRAWERGLCERCRAILEEYGHVTVDWTTIPELREKWAKYL